ncbi:MAG: hypothetical protein FWB86_04330 [Treponema sp.]|nr:hypothetical protein [Treponema sp.]MCL2250301.1 hypothetical protein [Treponema sp.]
MIQLYFLSILFNALAGYILFTGKDNDLDNSYFPIKTPTFYLILGILSIVTGVLKLLSPTLDGILILGDLVPSAVGVIAGLILIFGIYRQTDTSSVQADPTKGQLDRFGLNLLTFRKPIGIGLLAAALIHFLFPGALFL